jgi:hypothetical protein
MICQFSALNTKRHMNCQMISKIDSIRENRTLVSINVENNQQSVTGAE